MEISEFSDENFNYKTWINNFISNTNPENLQKELTDTVIKLQLSMQDVNNSIDDSTVSLCQNFPRLIREMENIKQESIIIREEMTNVKGNIEKVEKSTQDSMSNLLKFHKQIEKLTNIQNSLKEVDNWSATFDNIDTILKSENVEQIAEKIFKLQQSLSHLSSTPDYADKKRKIDHLCNKFEVILGPKLIQAFCLHDKKFIVKGLDLFDHVNLASCSEKYYKAWFIPSIKQQWLDLKTKNTDWKTNEELISLFFKQIFKFIEKELQSSVFTDSCKIILLALIEALHSLDFEFDEAISQNCADLTDSKKRMDFLVDIVKITDLFVVQLEDYFVKNDVQSNLTSVELSNLSNLIYCQLRGVNEIYANECSKYMQHRLDLCKMGSCDSTEPMDLLDKSIEDVVSIAQDITQYCYRVTKFTALDSIVILIKDLFNVYICEFKRVCTNITLKLTKQTIGQKSQPIKTSNSSSSLAADQCDNTDEYFFIQDAIKLSAIGGHFSIKFEEFIQETLSLIFNSIKSNQNDAKLKPVFLRDYPQILIESVQLRRKITDNWLQIGQLDSPSQLIGQSLSNYNSVQSNLILNGLDSLKQQIKYDLLKWLNKIVFDKILEPIKGNLENLSHWRIWTEESSSGEMLPQYAYSPQEYITKVGQFFLTLPQQLEPFINMSKDNQQMAYYLESIQNGRLPYMGVNFLTINSQISEHSEANNKDQSSIAHLWLDSIVNGCLDLLSNHWLEITALSQPGKQQLQADIAYIMSLVEDLDLEIPKEFQILHQIINCNEEQLKDIQQQPTTNMSQKILSLIKLLLQISGRN